MSELDQLEAVQSLIQRAMSSYRAHPMWEDAIQEGLIRAWRKMLDGGVYNHAYLSWHGVWYARRFLKQARVHESIDAIPIDHGAVVQPQMMVWANLFERSSLEWQIIISLHEGYNQLEIADRLHITRGKVQRLLKKIQGVINAD